VGSSESQSALAPERKGKKEQTNITHRKKEKEGSALESARMLKCFSFVLFCREAEMSCRKQHKVDGGEFETVHGMK